MFITKASLRQGDSSGSGALAAFLAGATSQIGQGHHLVWSCYDTQGGRPFLYRMTGTTPREPIIIVSETEPQDRHNLWQMETKPYSLRDNLANGDTLLWSMRLNAVIRHKAADGKKSAPKHCIVDDARSRGKTGNSFDIAADVVPKWLEPKLLAAGLEAPAQAMQVERYNKMRFSRSPGSYQSVTLGVTDLIGRGIVRDADKFRETLVKGIGHGRSYGCGLILVRRDR